MKRFARVQMSFDIRSNNARAWAIRVIVSCGAVIVALTMAPAMACTVSGEPLVFGQIDPLAKQSTDTVASLEVACPILTSYSITISHDGDGQRQMSDGLGNALAYGIYTDATLSNLWGDGTGGTQPVAGEAGPEGTQHEIHGRIPAQPYAVPGMYSATLFITVTY